MSNTGRVYFGLRGDFVPVELTQSIGIAPTSAAVAGERMRGVTQKVSIWEYSTEEIVSEVVDVYELSNKIVRNLAPFAEQIAREVQNRKLAAVLQVVLKISTKEETPTPAIGFEKNVIDFLHHVGGTIDIDTYKTV